MKHLLDSAAIALFCQTWEAWCWWNKEYESSHEINQNVARKRQQNGEIHAQTRGRCKDELQGTQSLTMPQVERGEPSY